MPHHSERRMTASVTLLSMIALSESELAMGSARAEDAVSDPLGTLPRFAVVEELHGTQLEESVFLGRIGWSIVLC